MENFFEKTPCKFKRTAKHLYESTNGLVLVVNQISSKKYIHVYHGKSQQEIRRFVSKPVRKIKDCLNILSFFFSNYNFNLDIETIKKQLDANPEKLKEIQYTSLLLGNEIYLNK